MKLTSYISTYQKDIKAFLQITLIYSVLLCVFWGHMGDLLIDCGREPFLSEEVLKGKLLFKDHIIFFGPLAYYIQALLFKIFGVHLNIIYAAGAFNAFIVLLLSYLISRTMTAINNSWLICLLIIFIFIFNTSVSNYIFPYTSCILYAVSSILFAVYFSILYLKTSKPLFMVLTGVFYGLSLLSKYEFIFFFIPLALIIFILKPLKFKYVLLTGLCTILPLLLGYGWLYVSGVSIDDFLYIIKTTKVLGQLPSLKYFYTCCVGFYPNWLVLKDTFISFLRFMIPFSILLFSLYNLINLIYKKRTKEESNKLTIITFIGIVITFLIAYYVLNLISFKDFVSLFSWLPIYNTLILMYFGFMIIIKPLKLSSQGELTYSNIMTFLKSKIKLKDRIMIFLLLSGLIATIKGFFFLSLDVYGPFLLLLAFIANVIFLFEYMPKYLKVKNIEHWQKSCFGILAIIGLLFIMKTAINVKDHKSAIIQTERGTIYSNKFISRTINSAITYINMYTPENSSILMLPENTILNFLTDRPTGSKYINLLPPNIAIYGEDKIISDFKKSPPDYIFVNNRNFFNNYFGKNYGKKIMSFILEEYKFKGEIGSKFKIYIFQYNGKKIDD